MPRSLALPFVLLLIAPACMGGPSEVAPADASTAAPTPSPVPVREKTVLSDVYKIDAKYSSMLGPWGQDEVYLWDAPEPELLWIVGYETTVIDAGTSAAMSQEFMCHANLDFDVQRYYDDFDTKYGLSGRVFTLSQGQQDIRFPDGFGIPIISTQPLTLTTQVLNLNLPKPDLDVRHQVTVRYVRDSELQGREMVPMYQGAVQGFKALEGTGLVYGVENPEMEEHGAGCEVGSSAIKDDVDYDRLGRKFTAHWVVEPGREVTRTLVTEFLNLEFDTTVHYIAVHLHPFAESLELLDRTTGEVVYRAEPKASQGRIGIDSIPYYTSVVGKPMYKDHEYELVAVYNNTSSEPVDSMAVMYLYMKDPTFKKPDLTRVGRRPEPEPEAPRGKAPGMGKDDPPRM